MTDPDIKDWERLRKAIPAVENATIDESLMQVYINLAEEEAKVAEEKKQYDEVWNKDNIDEEDVVNGIDEAMAKSHYWADSKKEDVVNSPSHYNNGSIECIEGIQASMSTEAFAGYLKGNCMKYLWRYDYKGKPVEDLQKAQCYLTKLIKELLFEEGEE